MYMYTHVYVLKYMYTHACVHMYVCACTSHVYTCILTHGKISNVYMEKRSNGSDYFEVYVHVQKIEPLM